MKIVSEMEISPFIQKNTYISIEKKNTIKFPFQRRLTARIEGDHQLPPPSQPKKRAHGPHLPSPGQRGRDPRNKCSERAVYPPPGGRYWNVDNTRRKTFASSWTRSAWPSLRCECWSRSVRRDRCPTALSASFRSGVCCRVGRRRPATRLVCRP